VKNSVKFLRSPIDSLLRRQQAIINQELYTKCVLFRAIIY
jgi:hypothetical protein